MKRNRVYVAWLGATVLLLPAVLVAQVDTNANPNNMPGQNSNYPNSYPQSPQNINQPSNMPGSNPPSGSQSIPSPSMHDSLGAPGQTGQQMLDKQFVRSAADSGITDVKIAMLAAEKGSPGVKDLAQKMSEDHMTINKDMASVADSLGVMLPKKMNKDGQAEYDKLSGLSGKEFDTEYVTYIARMHWQELHNFHSEASVAGDPNLQAEVVKAMGMMHDHIGLISKTAAAENIVLPPRPPRPGPTTASK